MSEVLSRVEGEQLAAACKVLAVTITAMDTYRVEISDDPEFQLARDSNKVTCSFGIEMVLSYVLLMRKGRISDERVI